jgi:SAM-dependent methyltransferase
MDPGSVAAFQEQTFTTRTGTYTPVSNAALAVFNSDAPIRILDIGCGDGSMIFELARHYPRAMLVGVDLSAANIRSAEERARMLGLTQRCLFLAGDYMTADIAPSDLIVSNSTLHLIDAPPLDVHRRVALNLNQGGVLIASVPCQGLYNTILIKARRIFRAIRSPATDRVIETVGRCLTRGKLAPDMIRERVVYMYIIPSFLAGGSFDRRLAQIGLNLDKVLPYPHASIAQTKHRVGIYRRGRRHDAEITRSCVSDRG